MLPYDHSDTADAIDIALETGQTIVFPTDTVYGIGGNPWDERTLNHVRRLKERDAEQPFTLHLWSVQEVGRYARFTPPVARIIEQLFPGPYTLLLAATRDAPPSAVLEGKIGIRVPDHPLFGGALRRPVFGTSVNRKDTLPLNDVAEIIENFTEVDLIVTGDVAGVSSAILDMTKIPYQLVRGTLSESAKRLLSQQSAR
ncbi:L-threonylcarbamoyladenylate synthase [Candidatus Bipolaricaulota bacterium]